MQLKRHVAIITAAVVCGLGQLAEAEGGKSHRGGKEPSHMSSRGAENTDAQWSADPMRGWVRSEEVRKRRNQQKDAGPGKEEKESRKGGVDRSVITSREY